MKNQGIFNKGIYGQTPAHELGHGAFGLKHTFDPEYGVSDNPQITRALNLMGYNDHAHLAKFQWDIIHQHSGETAFDSTDAVMARFTIIDSKHTQLFNHVYDNNLNPYKAGAGSYQTEDWPVAWTYSDDKPEELVDKVINKLRNAASGQTVPKITLRDNGIYVGKHTVGNNEYATAIYSRKAVIGGIKKVTVSDIKDLEKYHVLKQPLFCETAYANYVVIAFYEDGEDDPSLIIQAAKKGTIDVFLNTHLEAWMKYVGVMGDTKGNRDIILENARWISQFSPEINGRDCHWCGTNGYCCEGGTPCSTCPKDSNKKCCPITCTDSLQTTTCDSCKNEVICEEGTCKTNNCCLQTVLAMIEPFGVRTSRSQAIDIATLINDNSWKEQSDLQANVAKFNESITYIDETLTTGKPVLIGVHYQNEYPSTYNTNKATFHYMVIVGKIYKNDKEYYWFYDPGRESINEVKAKAATNLLEIDKNRNMIHGIYKNDKPYTITEIRKNL